MSDQNTYPVNPGDVDGGQEHIAPEASVPNQIIDTGVSIDPNTVSPNPVAPNTEGDLVYADQISNQAVQPIQQEVVEPPVAEVVQEPIQQEVVEPPVAEVVQEPVQQEVVEPPVAEVVQEPVQQESVQQEVVEPPVVEEKAEKKAKIIKHPFSRFKGQSGFFASFQEPHGFADKLIKIREASQNQHAA